MAESRGSHSPWIHTMLRCASLALAFVAGAGAFTTPSPLLAQAVMQRAFPANALRGRLVIGQPPEVRLNGEPRRLAPGARIRGENNAIVLSGTLAGRSLVVHYTLDPEGQLLDVWILTAAERERSPWPTTPEQAGRWLFDPIGQTWERP